MGGYQILRKVAQSNTAEIYHAVRLVGPGRGSEFALKILREEFANDRTERGYLENEFRVGSLFEHPNLIRVYDYSDAGGRPMLVLDLIQGPSLRQHLEKGRPPLGPALGWLAQAADGLACMHEEDYVHRDVKPQNILIDKGGIVKVIDFAIAMRQDTSLGKYLLRRLKERRRPGTWSYMSPEQIQNHRLTGQSDIYSLGVAVFEVAAGRLPYTADTAQGLMEQHVYGKIPSLLSVRNDAPMELNELVQAMVAKNPLDRPSGMRYVCAKLKDLAATHRALT